MARLRELGDAVEDTPQQDQDAPAPEATAADAEPDGEQVGQRAAAEATDGAQSPRKGRGGRAAGKKASAADKSRSGGARAATKAPAKKAAKAARKTAPPAQRSAPAAEHDEPVVRSVDTGSAERVGLYLDPDDYRELMLARIDDGANINARIRAMIALWRANTRFRSQVDRLARTARRGGMA